MYIIALMMYLGFYGMCSAYQTQMSPVESVFTNIYEKAWWWTGETYSGCGSNFHTTQLIRVEIPRIIEKYGIQSLLDIPCGDFHWMKEVPLSIRYIGAEIVKELVVKNQQLYGNNQRSFMHLDIIADDLPYADMVLCRDCLVHLSIEQIWQALRNIKRSGAKYLLTTGYSNTQYNPDIPTGNWRPVNLIAAPFNLPQPILIFNEGYERDKCLMLWKLDDLTLE